MRVSGGHARTVQTRLGPIKLRRAYGYCARYERWFHPADEVLGLDKRATASPAVQEASVLMVSKMPATEAAKVMERLTGMKGDDATMAREARRQGERAQQLRDRMDEKALDTRGRWAVAAEVKPRLATTPFTLVIEIDAWMIRERDQWGQSDALRHKGESVSRWHWVYTATVFRLGERAQTQSGRKMILSRGYVATRHGTEALSRQVYAEAVRQGLLHAENVLVVADGGVWIWKIVEDRFPTAHKRLDFYHASEHLWAVAHALHGDHSPAARAWVEPLLHQLRHGGERGVVRSLEELAATVEANQRELVERETRYFEFHKDHFDYQSAADRGEPIGSGAIESTCRQYQCRFKRPGQFWSLAGDEALLALETLWRNGRWHLLFPHAPPIDPTWN